MMFVYPALFHKEDGEFWVEFPDLKGCFSYGRTIPEAISYAQESLEGYLTSVLERGMPITKPTEIDDIEKPDDGFITLVTCDITPKESSKSVKKTLTIPSWLNDRGLAMGLNFSKVLQDGILREIQGI